MLGEGQPQAQGSLTHAPETGMGLLRNLRAGISLNSRAVTLGGQDQTLLLRRAVLEQKGMEKKRHFHQPAQVQRLTVLCEQERQIPRFTERDSRNINRPNRDTALLPKTQAKPRSP